VSRAWPESLIRLDGTLGVWTTTFESQPADHAASLAAELDEWGFSAVWIAEAWGRESFSHAALLLAGSQRITIATGIANIFARDAVASAGAGRTLNAAYNDRFVLGLGVSHQPLVERLRHHDYVAPLQLMEEYLAAMAAAPMFAPEAEHRYARVIAALRPKMLSLGGRAADGVHTYLVTPEHTERARSLVGDGFIAVEQAVVFGQTRDEYLRRAHAHLEIYTGLANYRNSWRELGFTEADFVRGGSERLCDAMVVHGDEAAIADRVSEHRTAGANHVCLQVLSDDLLTPPRDEYARLSVLTSP
jgi:probable F420-dependent oxidoreductase